jgi:hypothetical protein
MWCPVTWKRYVERWWAMDVKPERVCLVQCRKGLDESSGPPGRVRIPYRQETRRCILLRSSVHFRNVEEEEEEESSRGSDA